MLGDVVGDDGVVGGGAIVVDENAGAPDESGRRDEQAGGDALGTKRFGGFGIGGVGATGLELGGYVGVPVTGAADGGRWRDGGGCATGAAAGGGGGGIWCGIGAFAGGVDEAGVNGFAGAVDGAGVGWRGDIGTDGGDDAVIEDDCPLFDGHCGADDDLGVQEGPVAGCLFADAGGGLGHRDLCRDDKGCQAEGRNSGCC